MLLKQENNQSFKRTLPNNSFSHNTWRNCCCKTYQLSTTPHKRIIDIHVDFFLVIITYMTESMAQKQDKRLCENFFSFSFGSFDTKSSLQPFSLVHHPNPLETRSTLFGHKFQFSWSGMERCVYELPIMRIWHVLSLIFPTTLTRRKTIKPRIQGHRIHFNWISCEIRERKRVSRLTGPWGSTGPRPP